MRIVFMGTPEFAVPTLEAVASRHQMAGVFTQPDKPAGRGQNLAPPPVKRCAERLGLALFQPAKIRTPEVHETLRSLAPDAVVIVGYGKIIPQSIIDIPRLGCVNLHASLLPKYRGAAPVNWAIIRGETRTGLTTMKIDAGLDTGDTLLRAETEIAPEDDAESLGRRLAGLGAPLMLETLEGLESGTIIPQPQNHAEATLAPILKKEDGLIDWTWTAEEIVNRVRGLVPWPGAYSEFRGSLLHVWKARAAEQLTSTPGTLVARGRRLLAAAGEGSVELLELQVEGKRRIPAADFINGARLLPGESLRGRTAI
jgi:methionyl-tRNA formyltransferase